LSSRRRHTRWPRDWGSDVCSSDLARVAVAGLPGGRGVGEEERAVAQAELRVLLGDGRLRRQRPVVQRERGLDEPRDPSGGHRVRSEERRVGKEGRTWGWPG